MWACLGLGLFAGLPCVYGAYGASGASTGCSAGIRRRKTCMGWPQAQRQAGRGVDASPGAPGEARRCSSCNSRIAPALLGCRKPKLRARRRPLGNTCCSTSHRKSAPGSVRWAILQVSASRYWKVTLPFTPAKIVDANHSLDKIERALALFMVVLCDTEGEPVFVEVPAPTDEALQTVLHKVITRLMKLLTRRGVLVEEHGQNYVADSDGDSYEARTLRPLQAAACTYRIASADAPARRC